MIGDLILIFTNGLNLMETIFDTCADSVGNICASWILVFIVASIYGKCLGVSGVAKRVPRRCWTKSGTKRNFSGRRNLHHHVYGGNQQLRADLYGFANSIQKYRCGLYPVIWIA